MHVVAECAEQSEFSFNNKHKLYVYLHYLGQPYRMHKLDMPITGRRRMFEHRVTSRDDPFRKREREREREPSELLGLAERGHEEASHL